MGGNVRTGFEDILYYNKREIVKNSAQLVKRMVPLAKKLRRAPATVDKT
jgi:uncharacterized protein (DUF849 family)